jgi:protein TonB
MDLQSNLIESGKLRNGKPKGWKASLAALGVHGLIIAFVLAMSAAATHKVAAEDKPIRAFMASHAAPPPPPPPPPPPAASSAPKSTPVVKPTIVPKTTFVQPKQIPKEVPKLQPVQSTPATDTGAPTSSEPAGEPGGVPGGVAGGVVGGVQGGVVGGQVGGVLGGTLGGTPGGVVGGTPGGTGTEPAPAPPPEPPKPEGPLRVGGDVKAPVVQHRVDPIYSDMARKTHVNGIVIVEAIINKNGEVEQVKVIKGLPMGLSESAVEAVKQWKFKPGTLNGEPVDVIFNLTVNFKLD